MTSDWKTSDLKTPNQRPSDQKFAERRQFGRRQTHALGRIKIPGRPAISCLLKNVSDGGALLVFDKPMCLPFAFVLMLEGDSKTFGCEVRHHYGERVGVAFVDEALIPAGAQQSWITTNIQSSGPSNGPRS